MIYTIKYDVTGVYHYETKCGAFLITHTELTSVYKKIYMTIHMVYVLSASASVSGRRLIGTMRTVFFFSERHLLTRKVEPLTNYGCYYCIVLFDIIIKIASSSDSPSLIGACILWYIIIQYSITTAVIKDCIASLCLIGEKFPILLKFG